MNPEERVDAHDTPAATVETNPEEVETEDVEPDMPLDAYGCFYRDNLETYMSNNPRRSGNEMGE